jgi:hypothetical protein
LERDGLEAIPSAGGDARARQIAENGLEIGRTPGGGAYASRSFANAQQKNCVRLNNQGAASDAPPVRRQTAAKLRPAILGDSLSLGAADASPFDLRVRGNQVHSIAGSLPSKMDLLVSEAAAI